MKHDGKDFPLKTGGGMDGLGVKRELKGWLHVRNVD